MRFVLLLVGVGAAAFYVVAFGLGEGQRSRLAFDVYGYYYPHMLYALDRLAAGGQGLLWNPFQNCGQPFFGIGSTATLYPPHWLFLWLDPDLALRAVIVFHLVVAAAGMFALCRELGTSTAAAAAAAIAFELGNATLNVTAWMPIVA